MPLRYIRKTFKLHKKHNHEAKHAYNMDEVLTAFFEKDIDKLRLLMTQLNPYDKAEILNSISVEDFTWVMGGIFDLIEAEALIDLNDHKINILSHAIKPETILNILQKLDIEDISYFVSVLDFEKQQEYLALMPKEDRRDVKLALTYKDDQVGRMMSPDFLCFTKEQRIKDVLHEISNPSKSEDLSEDTRDVFIVDEHGILIGTVSLFLILANDPEILLLSILNPDFRTIQDTENISEIGFVFQKYNLTSLAVVGRDEKIIGVISSDVAMEVISEANDENLLRLSGVTENYDEQNVFKKAQSRFIWLFINLIAAICAAKVIGGFDQQLAKHPILALFLPVVASIGGNSGNQVAALMIRTIATKSMNTINKGAIFGKEFITSAIAGLFMIFLSVGIAYWISDSQPIALIFGISVGINILLSSIFGLIVPFVMKKMHFDPAMTSSICVTAMTDAAGFFIFLYLISIFFN
jgi:magnesium transporter